MPKSSMASVTPRRCSSCSTAVVCSAFCITMLSVTSSSTRLAGTPVSSSTERSTEGRSPRSSCSTDTFTAMATSCRPWWRQRLRVAQASRSTHSPIGRIRPDSSASGMNTAGEISPSSCEFQRSSASTPVMRPSIRLRRGWNTSRNSPRSSALRSAADTVARRRASASMASV